MVGCESAIVYPLHRPLKYGVDSAIHVRHKVRICHLIMDLAPPDRAVAFFLARKEFAMLVGKQHQSSMYHLSMYHLCIIYLIIISHLLSHLVSPSLAFSHFLSPLLTFSHLLSPSLALSHPKSSKATLVFEIHPPHAIIGQGEACSQLG